MWLKERVGLICTLATMENHKFTDPALVVSLILPSFINILLTMWSHRRLVLCGRRCIRLQRVNSGDVTLDSSRCFVRKAKKIKMSEQPKPDLGLLEEDDEFEEFPAEGAVFAYI